MKKIPVLNGLGGLLGKIGIKLAQLTPIYIFILIAWGDKFLPYPLSKASYYTRNSINNVLTGFIKEDTLKNNKYNNQKTDEIIKQTEQEYNKK